MELTFSDYLHGDRRHLDAFDGDIFFRVLCRDLEDHNLIDDAKEFCETTQEERTGLVFEFNAVRRLLICALLASIYSDGGDNTEIEEQRRTLRDLEDFCPEENGSKRILDEIKEKTLSDLIKNCTWPEPYNSPWMRNAIYRFRNKIDELRLCNLETNIVLIDEGNGHNGIQARLILEAYPGVETGLLTFPDPQFLSFTEIEEEFADSIGSAIQYASEIVGPNNQNVEICWSIICKEEDRWLKKLEDGSAGGAFCFGFLGLLQNCIQKQT